MITSGSHCYEVRKTPAEGPFLLPEVAASGHLGKIDSVPSDKVSQVWSWDPIGISASLSEINVRLQ